MFDEHPYSIKVPLFDGGVQVTNTLLSAIWTGTGLRGGTPQSQQANQRGCKVDDAAHGTVIVSASKAVQDFSGQRRTVFKKRVLGQSLL